MPARVRSPGAVAEARLKSTLLDDTVRDLVKTVLVYSQGNRTYAAFLLGVSRAKLYRLMKRYRLGGIRNEEIG